MNPKQVDRYVVATQKAWNIAQYDQVIRHFPGEWHLVTDPRELTPQYITSIAPKYVFFPHWSTRVPSEILGLATCIGFHETDLPYGRGGSPIQNLIARGHTDTVISALRLSEELDAGPIYLKEPLSLEGRAAEIFANAARIVAGMIRTIVTEGPSPTAQEGPATIFKRRTPAQSLIADNKRPLPALYDHIRMLDAEGYPAAFLEHAGFRFEFSAPSLRPEGIVADVRITCLNENVDD